MARAKDLIVADVKRVRREISRRLLAARRGGRLHEELTALEREGERACRDASKKRRGV
jgi:hypothetical protein